MPHIPGAGARISATGLVLPLWTKLVHGATQRAAADQARLQGAGHARKKGRDEARKNIQTM